MYCKFKYINIHFYFKFKLYLFAQFLCKLSKLYKCKLLLVVEVVVVVVVDPVKLKDFIFSPLEV